MLNSLKYSCLNFLNEICIYEYNKNLMHTNNKDLKNFINFIFNKNSYDYCITIDYSNYQINIDIYKINTNNILYNISIDLYNNKDAFNIFNDIILNKDNTLNTDFNYMILTINKHSLIIE